MKEQIEKLAVLFADVVGSTRLYERLGDVQAREQIAQCLADMSSIAVREGGKVVKTIGDELMCQFPYADSAVRAACEIQQSLNKDSDAGSVGLQVRIGFQYGEVVIDGKDLFGDTVNVAARMASVAQAGQIITTETTMHRLSPENQSISRAFDRVTVKGKQEEIVICQINWEQDLSALTNITPVLALDDKQTLLISHRGLEKTITPTSSGVQLGRNSQCEIVINSSAASRFHARLEYRRGKYMLVDTSTNGTYVSIQDGSDIYIRREELWLSGEGVISLGMPIIDENPDLIHFKCI